MVEGVRRCSLVLVSAPHDLARSGGGSSSSSSSSSSSKRRHKGLPRSPVCPSCSSCRHCLPSAVRALQRRRSSSRGRDGWQCQHR